MSSRDQTPVPATLPHPGRLLLPLVRCPSFGCAGDKWVVRVVEKVVYVECPYCGFVGKI